MQQQNSTNTPFTMQSLQRLKERKRAIAQQTTVAVSTTIDAKLMAQGMDIANLKKERDDIKKELHELKKAQAEERDDMMRRLAQVDAYSARFDGLVDRPETLQLINAAAKPLAERLEALEQSVAEQLAQLKLALDQSDAQYNLKLKPLLDRLDGLQATSSKCTQGVNLLRMAKELQNTDIDSLKRWKDAQPKAVCEEAVKKLITDEIMAKATLFTKNLSSKVDSVNSSLSKRITSNEVSISGMQAFKEKLEKQKLSDQLTTLNDKLQNLERNDAKTYAKADRLRERVEILEDEVSPEGVLQSTVDKLQEKVEKYRDVRQDVYDLQDDIAKYIGPLSEDYRKTNLPLSQMVTDLQNTVNQAELGRLPIRLDELEKVAEEKVEAVDKSIKEVDARLTGEMRDLRTRLMEDIQAPHNRTHAPSISASSADATTAQKVQSEVSSLDDIKADIDSLSNDLDAAEQRLNTHDHSISILQDLLPNLFKEQFDPFKAVVEKQLSTMTAALEAYSRDLSALTQEVSSQPSRQNGFGQQQERQQQQKQLDAVAATVTSLEKDLNTLRSSLSAKADAETMRKELEAFNFVLRNMESRWENISTDSLYQGMVRWFTHMYPALPKLQHDIDQVKGWMDARSGLLNSLSQDAAQLHSLVSIASHLITIHNEMPQTLAKIDQASSDAKLAITKVHQTEQQLSEQGETLEKFAQSVSVLQNSFHSLNSGTSSFKADALRALQTQLDTEKQERLASAGQLRTTLDADRGSHAEVEAKLRESITNLQRALESDKAAFAKAETLDNLERTLQACQSEVRNTQVSQSENMQALRSEFETDRRKRDATERDVKQSMNELTQTTNSDKALYAKAEALNALIRTVEALRSGLNREQNERSDSDKRLRTAITTDAGKILTLQKDTREFRNELEQIKSTVETTMPKIWEQFSEVNRAAAELRRAFDTTVSTYIEPNRDFFGLMGTALVVISQLQQVVESLNQNLPVGPLKLEWNYYLPTHGQLETNGESSNSKGKGKSKQ
jgi:chromosome segregation ATPase